MIEAHPLDTPIDRASLSMLPIEDALAFVQRIRERRLKAYSIYEAGKIAAQRKQEAAAMMGMNKRLEQFEKVAKKMLGDLEKLEKYANEIQGYRLILGDRVVGEADGTEG